VRARRISKVRFCLPQTAERQHMEADYEFLERPHVLTAQDQRCARWPGFPRGCVVAQTMPGPSPRVSIVCPPVSHHHQQFGFPMSSRVEIAFAAALLTLGHADAPAQPNQQGVADLRCSAEVRCLHCRSWLLAVCCCSAEVDLANETQTGAVSLLERLLLERRFLA